MNPISNAEAALMGLLAERPMYPYEIEQEFEYRAMTCWTELSQSSIYKLLRKLESEGLVTLESKVSPENRLRKLYTLSDSGWEAFRAKIESLISEAEETRYRVNIGLYNVAVLPKARARKAFQKYRQSLADQIKGYHELHEFLKNEGCPAYRFATATRPIALLEAEIVWLDKFVEENF